MTRAHSDMTGVHKLLRLARAEADALREDLADIERAQVSAAASLQALDENIRAEEEKAGAGPDLARYIDAARQRRRNLTAARATLSSAEEKARANLQAAFIEMKKLEHLLDVHQASARRQARKADAAMMEEAAAAMPRR